MTALPLCDYTNSYCIMTDMNISQNVQGLKLLWGVLGNYPVGSFTCFVNKSVSVICVIFSF